MAQVAYSAHALGELGQALQPKNVAAIQSAIDNLAAHPLVGRRLENDLRELIISFGETGYVALYRFVVQHDTVRVLSLRHQREVGYLP